MLNVVMLDTSNESFQKTFYLSFNYLVRCWDAAETHRHHIILQKQHGHLHIMLHVC